MKTCVYLVVIFTCILMTTESAGQTKREIGNLVIENIPDISDELRERLNQYQNTRGASPSSWSPDGEAMLMSTRFAETSQIHLIKNPGGARRQLTFFREPVGSASFCPNPLYNGFMFTKDIGGNEYQQLHWFDLSTGKYEMI